MACLYPPCKVFMLIAILPPKVHSSTLNVMASSIAMLFLSDAIFALRISSARASAASGVRCQSFPCTHSRQSYREPMYDNMSLLVSWRTVPLTFCIPSVSAYLVTHAVIFSFFILLPMRYDNCSPKDLHAPCPDAIRWHTAPTLFPGRSALVAHPAPSTTAPAPAHTPARRCGSAPRAPRKGRAGTAGRRLPAVQLHSPPRCGPSHRASLRLAQTARTRGLSPACSPTNDPALRAFADGRAVRSLAMQWRSAWPAPLVRRAWDQAGSGRE